MQNGGGPVVATDNLTRTFGSRRAVDGVSISVNPGQVLAIFGPNGAGKTTLLRILGGILKPSSGKATVGGVALPGGPNVRRRTGIVSHHSLLYDALTARENVEFSAKLYGVADVRAKAERALESMQILERADTPVRALSRGMKQRVSIARAMVHDPDVILADEPFTGLDIIGSKALSSLLLSLRDRGAALVLVTHNLGEGLSLATNAAIMTSGRIIKSQTRSSIDTIAFANEYQRLVEANG